MKALVENNLSENMVSGNIEKYNWPYSQPKILNIVKATSRLGICLGLLTIPIVLQSFYVTKGIFNIDLALVFSLVIMRAIIVPRVRRAQIRKVASENRTLNRTILIITTLLMYSAVIRLLVAIGLMVYNKTFSVDAIWNIISNHLYPYVILASIAVIIFPVLSVIYPKDISVIKYHYELFYLNKQIADRKNNPPVDYGYVPSPAFTQCYSRPYTMSKREPSTAKADVTVQKPSIETNHKQKPKSKPNTDTKKNSVWDADKSVRRPR